MASVPLQLLYDFLLIADVAKTMPADSDIGSEALFVANKIINTYRWACLLGGGRADRKSDALMWYTDTVIRFLA